MLAQVFAGETQREVGATSTITQGVLLDFARRIVWKLYSATKDQVLFKRKIVGLLSITVHVRDVRPLLVRWLGEPPADLDADNAPTPPLDFSKT